MITIEQCRAARGLLDWTQQDLADASGMSKTAINNFEKGHSDIKAESLRAIRMAFESANIEFLGAQGLQKHAEHVELIKGTNALSDLMDDIYETMKNEGGEILIADIHEEKSAPEDIQQLRQMIERLKPKNVKERILCREDDSNNWSEYNSCRYISRDKTVSALPSYIYGSKVAIQLWKKSVVIILDSREASKAERAHFEYLWSHAHAANAYKEEKRKQA